MILFLNNMKIVCKIIPVSLVFLAIFLVAAFISYSDEENVDDKENYSNVSVKINIVDQDKTELSKSLTRFLENGNEIVEVKDSDQARWDAIYYNEIGFSLVIKKGFQKSQGNDRKTSLKMLYAQSSLEGRYMEEKVMRYLSVYEGYKNGYLGTHGASQKRLCDETEFSLIDQVTTRKREDLSGDNISKMANTLNLAVYPIFAVISYAICIGQKAMDREELKLKNLLTPGGKKKAFFAELLSNQLVTLLTLVAVFGLLFLVTAGEVLNQKWPMYFLNFFLLGQFTMTASYLAKILISERKRRILFVHAFSILGAFLSGAVIPIASLSSQVEKVARIVPGYYFSKINNRLTSLNIVAGDNYHQIFQWMGILVLYIITFVMITAVVTQALENSEK